MIDALRRSLALRRLLVAFLVPVVWVASTPELASAAENQNPWQSLDLKTTRSFEGDITCRLIARYTPEGAGVVWNDAACINGVDIDPYMDSPPEEGTDYELTFKGLRLGAPEGGSTWAGASCGATTIPATITVLCDRPAGATTWQAGQMYIVVDATSPIFGASLCVRKAGTTQRYGMYGTYPADTAGFPAGSKAYSIGRTNYPSGESLPSTGYGEVEVFNCTTDATLAVIQIRKSTATDPYTPPTSDAPPGTGAGDPCEVTEAGDMGPSDEQSLSHRAGTIPGGTLPFPPSDAGLCQVNEVCVEWSFRDFPSGTATVTGCAIFDWGPPYEEPSAPEIPDDVAPPTLDNETPHAEDEQDFWDKVLDLLLGLLQQIAKGLKAVVDAVGFVVDAIADLATALLDGIAGLFIPEDGYLDGQIDGVKDAWADAAPIAFLGGLTDVGEALQFPQPPSGCAGPELSFHSPMSAPGSTTNLNPLSACRSEVAQIADLTKTALTIAVYVGAVLASVRIVGAAFGVNLSLGGKDGEA